MKKSKKNKFNNLKKDIKDFIKDEKGFVSKENILKIGLGTISALGIMSSLTHSFAGHTSHSSHKNVCSPQCSTSASGCCVKVHFTHTNSSIHTNHASY